MAGELIAAIAGIIGTIIVSLFTYFMARRAGIGPYQDTIVSKLKDLVEIQANEITTLKAENSSLTLRIDDLEKSVEELKDLTVAQALQLKSLSKPPTRPRKRVVPLTSKEGEN